MKKPQTKLLWVFPSFGLGPAADRFATISTAMGSGYDHSICALDGDFTAESAIGPSVRWRRVAAPVKRRNFISLGSLWSYRRLLSNERPDMLVTQNWGGVEWLMVNRGPGAIPHVHFEDGSEPEDRPGSPDQKRAWARRRAFPGRHRAFVAPSRAMHRLMTGDWAAPEEAVHYIPDGVDVAHFASPPREGRGRMVRLAAVGPLLAEKRGDRLLKMVAELRKRGRDVGLVFVGDGPERSALEAEARALEIDRRVDFVGDQHDIAPFLAQFDVFVMASDSEAVAGALPEAMASGLPIVATDVGDVADRVDSANQLFVRPPSDESALIAAAELMVSDKALRDRLGLSNGRRAAREFSKEAMVRRYDALFRDMIRRAKPLMLPAPSTSAQSA